MFLEPFLNFRGSRARLLNFERDPGSQVLSSHFYTMLRNNDSLTTQKILYECVYVKENVFRTLSPVKDLRRMFFAKIVNECKILTTFAENLFSGV